MPTAMPPAAFVRWLAWWTSPLFGGVATEAFAVAAFQFPEVAAVTVPGQEEVAATAVPGQVDGVFAFAAPGTATPALRNPLSSDGCFPGLRTWTATSRYWVLGKQVDFPTMVGGVVGYRHPMMDAAEFSVDEDEDTNLYNCSEESPEIPRGVPNLFIHDVHVYAKIAAGLGPLMYNVSYVAMINSYIDDEPYVRMVVARYGYHLVGHAVFEGTKYYGGIQSSYLMQHPVTKECMLTFKGTGGAKDVANDLDALGSHFCGLVREPCADGGDEDEACMRPLAEGENLVHRGFRDRLRQMVQTEGWQTEVRPKLPSCSKVYVAGHSMGGAMAELFAACTARAPSPEEYGYEEDYKYISWSKMLVVPTTLESVMI